MYDSEEEVLKQQSYVEDITTSSDEDSGRESDLRNKNYEWQKQKTIHSFLFNKTGYLKVKTNKEMNNYFDILFNDEFISNLISSINGHALMNMVSDANGQVKAESWFYVVEKEMKTFLGLLLYINQSKEDNLPAFWEKQMFKIPVKNYMKYERFMAILNNFCFSDKKIDNSVDDAYQYIGQISDYFNKTMEELVTPTKNLTIDTTVIEGNADTRAYFLIDAKGVVNRVKFYKDEKRGTKQITKTVLDLMGNNLNSGHSIFLNKDLTSVYLAETLINKKTHLTGELSNKSIDINHKTNSTMKNNSKGIAISNFAYIEDKDKQPKSRFIISTEYEAEDMTNDTQTSYIEYKKLTKAIERKNYFTPKLEYNTKKHYTKVTIHILNVMLSNAFILYTEQQKTNTDEKITFKKYSNNIIYNLLGKIVDSENLSTLKDANYDKIHLPLKQDQEGECVRCFQSLFEGKKSQFYCPNCDEKPALCLTCFRSYHNY